MLNPDIKEIESITFGVYSPEEILNMSVAEINIPRLNGQDRESTMGTVYDTRMGTIDNGKNCDTCQQNVWDCPGHFGHIELNEAIIHPLYYKQVTSFLKCFCKNCQRLLIQEDHIKLSGIYRFKGEKRFEKVLEKLEKVDMCCYCSHPQPEIKYNTTDNSISMVYKQKDQVNRTILLSVSDIQKIFENILNEDIVLLGFDPFLVHPRNFIFIRFPVIPPQCRPYVIADGNTCDDDLTNQLVEIIKLNNHLANKDYSEVKLQKFLQSLKFRIQTFMNNSQGKAKHTTNNRPFKCIKERLTGKEGQLRNYLLGKRCDQTARTVIGPDPTLRMGELAIPRKIANILTVPVRVNSFNFEEMSRLVNNGEANFVLKQGKTRINLNNALIYRGTQLFHGDIIIRKGKEFVVNNGNERLKEGDKVRRNGVLLEKLEYPRRKFYHLSIGDIVERKLRDGDIVLLNRQPTLHSGSMMAQTVKVMDHKTIRMNLAITKSFNADFDGDEMNLHVPQSLEAQAELRMLSASKYKMISAQASKPNMCIVQDSLLGAYKMTLGTHRIKKEQFFDICMKLEYSTEKILNKIKHIRRILKQKGKNTYPYTTKNLVSLILEDDLIYEKNNKADPEEPVLKIYRGVLYEGTLDKSVLGTTYNSLIQIIHKEYGEDQAAEFIDHIQFISNSWLMISGFSIGISDCLVQNKEKEEEISDVIRKCFIEAEGIKETTVHPGIREMRITSALSKAKDIGLRIAKDSLSKDNNFLSTVLSGSKGDFFNIAQITGLLGQQNLQGRRVEPVLNHGKRTLPHYPMDNLPLEMQYESKGFIASSFIHGLNPREFYFHAMSGREGVCDTALGTSTSGYMQRRIIKLTEDIKIQYDRTVQDAVGKIYHFSYGENGMNPTETVKVNGVQSPCNIPRLVDKLNMLHEIENESEDDSDEDSNVNTEDFEDSDVNTEDFEDEEM